MWCAATSRSVRSNEPVRAVGGLALAGLIVGYVITGFWVLYFLVVIIIIVVAASQGYMSSSH